MFIILDLSKLKAIADKKLHVTIKFGFYRIEIIVGREENSGIHQFLFFPQCLQKRSSSGSLEVWIVWSKVNFLPHNQKCELFTKGQNFNSSPN